jgi:hypothetical protein
MNESELSASGKKLVILGAGATRGAATINPDFPPPLLNDLADLFNNRYIGTNSSPDGYKIRETYNALINRTNLKNDLEEFYTVLWIVEQINALLIPGRLMMTVNDVLLLLDSVKNNKEGLGADYFHLVINILEYYLGKPDVILPACPRNLKTFIERAIYDYLYFSIKDCFCPYHIKLLSLLGNTDVVVSFNYDQLADIVLLKLGKLSEQSFNDLGFTKITLPNQSVLDNGGTKFIKVHGSTNWMTDHEPWCKNVYYNLLLQGGQLPPSVGNTSHPMILPVHHKKYFYTNYPIYAAHIDAFKRAIMGADEIYLIGKNFNNADRELNDLISEAAIAKKKLLHIIDLKAMDGEFADFHSKLFNATLGQSWKTLKDFYEA